MEAVVPFLIVAFLFALTWLVAMSACLSSEPGQPAEEGSVLDAVTPQLERARFLADPAGAPPAGAAQVDAAVIHGLESYLEQEQSCAARFVDAPSIELLYRRSSDLTAVA